MMELAVAAEAGGAPAKDAEQGEWPAAEVGYIGRIPVRNIWLLLLYASDLFRASSRDRDLAGAEENPDEISDLVARILARAVEDRRRRNLSLGLVSRRADLTRVRGRIDVLRTERRQLAARGAVACRFFEFSVDTPRNRYVRAALETVSKIVADPELRRRCRRLAADMHASGVSIAVPSRAELGADRIGRHDAADAEMLAAARLAMNLVLPTERGGNRDLRCPDREERWARGLFERAIGGFYDVVLPSVRWRVRRSRSLRWQVDRESEGAAAILPGMVTDIELDDAFEGRRIVIDTKFTGIVTRGWRREATLRSGYIYQIYAYLRSQEGRGCKMADGAEGILLHPAIEEMVDEDVSLQGHRIRFATVDLAAEGREIRKRLLELVAHTRN